VEHAGQLAIEVLVDLQTLKPGQPWPIQLHEMMAYCHAGVLLLTKSAVGSAWVLKEATILAWRAALDTNFRLFVVQLPTVRAEDLRAARFDPVMLDQMQRVLAQDPTDIAKKIVELSSAHATAVPLDTLVSDLSILLKQVDPDRLAEIRRRLELPPPPWRPGPDNADAANTRRARQLRDWRCAREEFAPGMKFPAHRSMGRSSQRPSRTRNHVEIVIRRIEPSGALSRHGPFNLTQNT
jgi:hypothetical protein